MSEQKSGFRRHSFTFESTGIAVSFRTVSLLVRNDVVTRMAAKRPKPDVERMEVAGVMQDVELDEDPAYIEKLEAFDLQVQEEVNRAYVKRSHLEIEYPGWRDEVAAYRSEVAALEAESDEWIFVTRIAASGREVQSFMGVLLYAGQPSREQEDAVKSSFRSTVAQP